MKQLVLYSLIFTIVMSKLINNFDKDNFLCWILQHFLIIVTISEHYVRLSITVPVPELLVNLKLVHM